MASRGFDSIQLKTQFLLKCIENSKRQNFRLSKTIECRTGSYDPFYESSGGINNDKICEEISRITGDKCRHTTFGYPYEDVIDIFSVEQD